MIYLNDEAILYAISMCRRRRGYKVGIVTGSMRNIPHISDMIMYCLRECLRDSNTYVVTGSRISPNLDVSFENGSRIFIIPHSGAARGQRAHLLVVDENIDYERYQQTYRHIECLEEIEAQVRHHDRVDTVQWFNRDWFAPHPLTHEKEISDVSEDEFLKVIAG